MGGIERAVTVGVTQEHKKDDIPVIIAIKSDESVSKMDVLNYLEKNLPQRRKLISEVFFTEAFPTTPAGKLKKYLVKKFAEEQMKM